MSHSQYPSTLPMPPPSRLDFDLVDGDRKVGWIRDNHIGFHGFETRTEAAHAAWVGYRALARETAKREGRRPPLIDLEPLTLVATEDGHEVRASGRRIAGLIGPGAESRTGDSYGFELEVAARPPQELTLRAQAMHAYRTLRRSGVRWALWRL